MRLTMMAAADLDWGIGIEGRLPWHLPQDLRRFKERTMGKAVVMGRKTVATLPSKLPGRRILTLTRSPSGGDEYDLEGLLERLTLETDEVIVAGGAEVYRALLPYCDAAEITRIRDLYATDTRMVDLSKHGWEIVNSMPFTETSDIEEWKRT